MLIYVDSCLTQHVFTWLGNLRTKVGAVVNMAQMFSGATSFDVDISSWQTNAATSMVGMFGDAQGKIKRVDGKCT